MRVLLIEDENLTAGLVKSGLEAQGLTVDHVTLAADAEAATEVATYDAIVLDLGLPDEDGLALLRGLRRRHVMTPIVIMTARGRTAAKIEGLDAGADDYIVKPVEVEELAARLRALARRPREVAEPVMRCGNLTFAPAGRGVTVGDRPLSLPRRELGVLEILLRASGRIVPKTYIEDQLYSFDDALGSNSVEVHVHHLRRHLAEAGAIARIETHRGLGYSMAAPAP